jgi:MFS family permease
MIFSKHVLRPWLVCVSAALFFFYEFVQMGLFNAIGDELRQTFSMNATQLGQLSARYFYADVSFLFFVGILLDRFSVRMIVLAAMWLTILSTLLFALSHSLLLANISHFATGIGNAFCFLSCIKLATNWFPPRHLALVIGVMVSIAFVGGIVAQTPFSYLADAIGWRQAVLVDVVLGFGILMIIYWFVYDQPAHLIVADQPIESIPIPTKDKVIAVILNMQNWFAGLYTCLLNLPIFLLGELWGITYLMTRYPLSKERASIITSMLFIGTMIGAPLSGWLSDRLRKRRLIMIWGAIFSLITISMIYVSDLTFLELVALFFSLGFFTSTQVISYPLIAESNPHGSTGTATGLASLLIMGGGAVFQPLFGRLLDLHWDHTSSHGIPIYKVHDYLEALLILPIGFVISLIAAWLLRETGQSNIKPQHS